MDVNHRTPRKKTESQKKKTWLLVLVNLLAMVAVVFIIPYAVLLWIDGYTHHGESYQVPNVCGMQLEDAKQLLRENHLDLEIVDYKYKNGAAENEVVEQSPVANSKVKEGRKIMLTMNSLDRPMAIIPDVIDNSSMREAEARLKSLGFIIAAVDTIQGEKDWVYEVKYAGVKQSNGASIPKGSSLVIVIGDGEELVEDEALVDEDYFE
jgi:beta-lactam-binding protein with PASTA domain